MRLIMLGAPGAGKGTQASKIVEVMKIPHISTGDIFRQNIRERTPLGIEAEDYIHRGSLVPDELTIKIVEKRLLDKDCNGGFLLDGFPRTISQALALEIFLDQMNMPLDMVLFIDVPESLIIERNTGRRVCSNCGRNYHIKYNPSKTEGICDICNGQLFQRKDDNDITVKERLGIYRTQTMPLIEHYSKINLLKTVGGQGEINEVFNRVEAIINK